MTAYVDSSIVLRIVLGEARPLREWRSIERPFASELVQLECLRTLDRMRFRASASDAVVAERRAAVIETLRGFELVRVGARILRRAADPFPTSLATLDAIHLATALSLRDEHPGLTVATHDTEFATAARAMGFAIAGV